MLQFVHEVFQNEKRRHTSYTTTIKGKESNIMKAGLFSSFLDELAILNVDLPVVDVQVSPAGSL